MNFRQLTYGLLSYIPGIPGSLYTGTGGTDSAAYCYCVWLRHLVLARSGGMDSIPSVVAELGPGDSIGTGLAALISGAEKYIALDAVKHTVTARNLTIFDALVDMFRSRLPIPGPEQFPEIAMDLPSWEFPAHILTRDWLDRALAPERLERLRQAVRQERNSPCLEYLAPWSEVKGFEGCVDLLISQAVMEHVDDLRAVYQATSLVLKCGGYSSHQIDFRSHGLFNAWDGHWACPDWLWTLIRGRKPYLLNREPLSTHVRMAGAAGLQVREVLLSVREPESPRLASRFDGMTESDRTTCGAYLLSAKAGA